MATNRKCPKCEGYEKQLHNFCRMCGTEFKPNHVKHVRRAVAYNSQENFCGYCGGEKNNCSCH